MAFEIGQHVGDYEIVQLLGVGGMGHVYRVRNVISDRTEAMKVLLPDLTAERDLAIRFISEIRTLAGFDHPNIALLHTAFQADNQLIMMMEFVEGSTLEQKAKQGPMSISEVCGYTYQALSALSYAHSRGVVHRDIKPANIMLTSHGIVKLMDFGIAKSNVETNLTRPGTTIGSLYYMSPEQVRGDAVDGRSDLYSVGIMLYELLAGRRPFEADTTFSILNQQLNAQPQPPIELNPALPRALNDVILHALAKSPDERYQSADNFRDALRPFCPNQTTEPGHIAIAPSAPTAAMGGAAAAIVAADSAIVAHPPLQAAAAPPFTTVTTPPAANPYGEYPPPTSSTGQKSHKGLWIATGIAAAVLAMVALGFAVPHWMGTHAAESADGSQPTGQAASQTAAPSSSQTNNGQGEPSVPGSSGTTGSPTSRQTPAAPAAMSDGTVPVVGPAGASSSVTGGAPKRSASIAMAPAGGGQPAAGQPDALVVHQGPSAAQLEEVQTRFTDLSARAGSVGEGLNNLRRQQEASGYGLRGDMAAADNRLQSYMRAADQDLRTSNVVSAGRDLSRAEAELTTLEKFLGR